MNFTIKSGDDVFECTNNRPVHTVVIINGLKITIEENKDENENENYNLKERVNNKPISRCYKQINCEDEKIDGEDIVSKIKNEIKVLSETKEIEKVEKLSMKTIEKLYNLIYLAQEGSSFGCLTTKFNNIKLQYEAEADRERALHKGFY